MSKDGVTSVFSTPNDVRDAGEPQAATRCTPRDGAPAPKACSRGAWRSTSRREISARGSACRRSVLLQSYRPPARSARTASLSLCLLTPLPPLTPPTAPSLSSGCLPAAAQVEAERPQEGSLALLGSSGRACRADLCTPFDSRAAGCYLAGICDWVAVHEGRILLKTLQQRDTTLMIW